MKNSYALTSKYVLTAFILSLLLTTKTTRSEDIFWWGSGPNNFPDVPEDQSAFFPNFYIYMSYAGRNMYEACDGVNNKLAKWIDYVSKRWGVDYGYKVPGYLNPLPPIKQTDGLPWVYYCGLENYGNDYDMAFNIINKSGGLIPWIIFGRNTYQNQHNITVKYHGVIRSGDICTPPKKLNKQTGGCELPKDDPKNDPGTPCTSTGKPINFMTGNKWLDEVDYAALGHSPLTFTRHYNSNGGYQYQGYFGVSGITQNPLGPRWTHSYYQGLVVTADEVQYRRNNGQTFSFKLVAGRWIPDADVDYRLHERMTNGIRIGWLVTTPAGRIETYSALGDLLKITERDGGYQIFTYSCKTQGPSCPVATPPAIAPDAGLLIRVSDNFGRSLNFTYNQFGKMASMTDPSGKITLYQYGSGDALKVVVYPDDTPTVSTDNPKKTYIYGGDTDEQVNTAGIEQPYVLTGIVDEIGVRYMTYQYDAEGRAVNEYSIGDIDKYHLDFATDGFHTNVMDPSGTVRAHTTTMVLGVMQPSGTSQPKVVNQAGVTTCPASDSNIEYNDTTGNVTSRTDFKNHKTCYQYEIDTLATGRNLETARVEGLDRDAVCATVLADSTLSASPTNSIRKISTEWHPSYHLPTKIAEPNRLTTNVYDASGNLQSRSELATNDSTGAKGFAATGIGTARTWNYIYHTFGRIKREDGPRTDITTDVTNYEYYPDDDPDLSKRGNLKEIVRPLGQTTTFNSYNLNGQPTQITAPNKVVTELAYHPRGWLETLTVKDQGGNNAETTEYAYYPTGLLQLVTLPDKTRLKYLYDPAHRLIEIQQLDNNLKAENVVAKVHYELDAMGNRKEEEYRDPAGNLKRNIVRAYDALNRLQTVTGADQ